MKEAICNNCGSDVFIAEYYNTELDHETSLDVMGGAWIKKNKDVLERVDCAKCSNMIISPQSL